MKAGDFLAHLTNLGYCDYFAGRRLIRALFNFDCSIDSEREVDDVIVKKTLTILENNPHYPLEYLEGSVIFYRRIFQVSPGVLIPRNETEELVGLILDYCAERQISSVLDIGTGSGVLGITLSCELKVPATLLDLSATALKVARANAVSNQATVTILQSDYLAAVIDQKLTFDLVVSNPPYVGEADSVGQETRYEPKMALYSTDRGLQSYHQIIQNLDQVLNPEGVVFFETSSLHHREYCALQQAFPHFKFSYQKDLSGKWRFMILKRKAVVKPIDQR